MRKTLLFILLTPLTVGLVLCPCKNIKMLGSTKTHNFCKNNHSLKVKFLKKRKYKYFTTNLKRFCKNKITALLAIILRL